MIARTQEFPYQVIAYIHDPELGKPVGPPWRTHVTVKRRFKLRDGVNEHQLVKVLEDTISAMPAIYMQLGGMIQFGNSEAIEVTNHDQ